MHWEPLLELYGNGMALSLHGNLVYLSRQNVRLPA
jgi:hypothetical protein